MVLDTAKAQKFGLEEYIAADPSTLDYEGLFATLLHLIYNHQMNGTFVNTVRNNKK